MEKVSIKIDGIDVQVPKDNTVLQAARSMGINIPTLCYLEGINKTGACRMCLVEIDGDKKLHTACTLAVWDGMIVKTNTKRVRDARKTNLRLILANHHSDCLSCSRSKNCELQDMCSDLGLSDEYLKTLPKEKMQPIDELSPSIVRDPNKCILCGRCVAVCKNVQNIEILTFANRGLETSVEPAFGDSFKDTPCIYCGQCINVCPVAALREKSEMEKVWEALENKDLHVVVQEAPAVRAALGEEFGLPMGTPVTGKMYTALRMLGFDKVFDTNFGADLTIMEEGTELLHRIKEGGKLPMITSCSPGWIRYIEHYYPDLLEHLSTCKSPQQMTGAVLKSYYPEIEGLDPKKVFVVSVMPCTSKKFEAAREEMLNGHGTRDVDAVLTTRELAKMIRESSIDFASLSDSKGDDIFSDYTGAGVIFGATGGVMEAAIRTVADVVSGQELDDIEYKAVRGLDGIKEASVQIGDLTVNVAVAHGTDNAQKLMELIREGKADYHFIEVMACPGGCVAGGGQPHVHSSEMVKINVRYERAKALYTEDFGNVKRKSHHNTSVQRLYKEYLGEPCGHKSHELLHTHYKARTLY